MDTHLHTTRSEQETIALGKTFAVQLEIGDVVALYGDLGSGKTEFAKGMCQHFNVEEIVSSPTFTVINQYSGTMDYGDEVKIYHVDLYRINSPKELGEIGFSECVHAPDAIKLVEWADKADDSLPQKRYSIIFQFKEEEEETRLIEIRHTDENDAMEKVVLPIT